MRQAAVGNIHLNSQIRRGSAAVISFGPVSHIDQFTERNNGRYKEGGIIVELKLRFTVIKTVLVTLKSISIPLKVTAYMQIVKDSSG